MIKVDFSRVDSFEPVPAGVYPVTVVQQDLRSGQTSGSEYINWTLQVSSGEYQDRKFWVVTSLSPKALWKLQETLVAFGLSEKDRKSSDFEFNPEDFLGAECRAVIIQETYNGRLQNRVDKVLAPEMIGAPGVRRRPPRIQ